jgi:hypothetical protein
VAPSALPGSNSNVVLPPDEDLPSIETRSHRRAVPSETAESGTATTHGGRHGARHHRLSRSRQSYTTVASGPVETPYYVSPLGWGFNSPVRSCVWERHWDGYWAPSCL